MLIYILAATAIASIVAEIIFIAQFVKEHAAERRRIVQKTSIMFKKLLEINSQYRFDWSVQQQYQFSIDLQSKAKLDRYQLMDLFDDAVFNRDLMRVANGVAYNRDLYSRYLREISELKSEITPEQAKKLRIPYKKYIEIEKEMFAKKQLRPVIDCDIVCTASYSSPKGRNHYSKTHAYSVDMAKQRYTVLQQKIDYQNSEEMRRKRARSQMTDKLRYKILKRDGFRCQLCGRTANDGVKLHVDHIIPVSKGGETIPENLRTLCEACNLGKSDEIES